MGQGEIRLSRGGSRGAEALALGELPVRDPSCSAPFEARADALLTTVSLPSDPALRVAPGVTASTASPAPTAALSTAARTAAAVAILSGVAKAGTVGGVGLAAASSVFGPDPVMFAQAVGAMAVSIAADAMANVVSQNNKLTGRGVIGYATAIGGSHAIYPLVGFASALLLEGAVHGVGALSGSAGVDPETARRVAQGVVATAVYGVGSLFLFRFLKNDMIPDFAGHEEAEEAEGAKAEPKSFLQRLGARFEGGYERGMHAIESRLLDTSQGGIESFNSMRLTPRNLLRSLRHPDVVRCSMDSFVSTFAKTAFIASLPLAAQVSAIGLTSVAVFGLVLAAGVASRGAFTLLRRAIERAVEHGDTPPQEQQRGLFRRMADRAYAFIHHQAVRMNHWVGVGFKGVALATLGGFAAMAGGEAVANLAEAVGLGRLGDGARGLLAAGLFALYAVRDVGLANVKAIWRVTRDEAAEVVTDIEGQEERKRCSAAQASP